MNVQFESEADGTEAEIGKDRSPEDTSAEDARELKITVRKLEVPVRPRGVLAE
jgi:hypothetical protein